MNNVNPAPEVLHAKGRVFPGPLSIAQFMIVDMKGPYRYQPFKIISMFRRVENGIRGARQVQLQVDRV